MKPGMDFIYAIGAFSVVVGYLKTSQPLKYILDIFTNLRHDPQNSLIMPCTA
jgi:hypothetical protein